MDWFLGRNQDPEYTYTDGTRPKPVPGGQMPPSYNPAEEMSGARDGPPQTGLNPSGAKAVPTATTDTTAVADKTSGKGTVAATDALAKHVKPGAGGEAQGGAGGQAGASSGSGN